MEYIYSFEIELWVRLENEKRVLNLEINACLKSKEQYYYRGLGVLKYNLEEMEGKFLDLEHIYDLVFLHNANIQPFRAVARMSRNASIGSVVYDLSDKWIFDFNHYLGNCSPFEAEL